MFINSCGELTESDAQAVNQDTAIVLEKVNFRTLFAEEPKIRSLSTYSRSMGLRTMTW